MTASSLMWKLLLSLLFCKTASSSLSESSSLVPNAKNDSLLFAFCFGAGGGFDTDAGVGVGDFFFADFFPFLAFGLFYISKNVEK
jgi:hypothetical protein